MRVHQSRVLTLLLFSVIALASSSLWAEKTTRFALLFGANEGGSGDETLRYALRDVERVRDALVDVGGFKSENIVVLNEPNAQRVREALASVNARIRREQQNHSSSMLFVYYSGHAGAEALHLGGSDLPWSELRNLTIASAANARVLVADACRSGQVTRVKGFEKAAPFIVNDEEVPEGFAVLSSAAAGESAQESDAIEGSFFTHHFVSGLRGTADENRDGQVTLSELYQYAALQTVAATVKTLSGTQHPTYSFDLKGRKALVMTQSPRETLAKVRLRNRGDYWFRKSSEEGRVVLEARLEEGERDVMIPAGDYFVQVREKNRFRQSSFKVAAGENLELSRLSFREIAHAQLARKGTSAKTPFAFALLGEGASSALEGLSPPVGLKTRIGFVFEALSIDAAFGVSSSGAKKTEIETRLQRFDLSLALRRAFDVSSFSFSFGVRGGAQLFRQRYITSRLNTPRTLLVPFVEPLGQVDWHLPFGLFTTANVALRTQLLNKQVGLTMNESVWSPSLQVVGALGIGKYF